MLMSETLMATATPPYRLRLLPCDNFVEVEQGPPQGDPRRHLRRAHPDRPRLAGQLGRLDRRRLALLQQFIVQPCQSDYLGISRLPPEHQPEAVNHARPH